MRIHDSWLIKICFFPSNFFWAILPAPIWLLVRLTEFCAWGLDGLWRFADKCPVCAASLRDYFEVLAGTARFRSFKRFSDVDL